MLVGIGRLALPYADHLRPWLAQTLSERLDQPVTLDRIEATWPRLMPVIHLHGMQVGDADNRLEIASVVFEGRADRLIRGDRLPFDVVVSGLLLQLTQDEQGDWSLQSGQTGQLTASRGVPRLPGGNIRLREARLIMAPMADLSFDLRIREAELLRQGNRLQARGQLGPWQSAQTPLSFVLEGRHGSSAWQSVRGWLGTGHLLLNEWLPATTDSGGWPLDVLGPQAYVDAELFIDWDRQSGTRLDGRFTGSSALGDLQGHWLAERVAGRTQIDVPSVMRDQHRLIEGLTLAKQTQGWVAMADHLDLAALHEALHPWLRDWPAWPIQISGEVRALSVVLDQHWAVSHAAGRLHGLGWQLPPQWPSIAQLNLDLDRSGDRLSVKPSGAAVLDWPQEFGTAIAVDELTGELRLSADHIEVVGLAVDSAVAAGRLDGWLHWSASPDRAQTRPFMDLLIQVDRVTATDPRPFLPKQRIPPPAMQWLEGAFEWVETASGTVLLHTPFGTATADLTPGGFWADVAFAGVRLRPWPDWSLARSVNGRAEFVGRGLSGQLSQAQLDALRLGATSIRIADLEAPVLQVNTVFQQAEAADLAGLLAASPIPGWAEAFAPLAWSGQVSGRAQVQLPLREAEAWQMAATLTFLGTDLVWQSVGVKATDLRGRMAVDQNGLRGLDLSVAGEVEDETSRSDLVFDLDWTGPLTLKAAANLAPHRWLLSPRLSALAQRSVEGESRWQLQLSPAEDGSAWHLHSDLLGSRLHLPAPLAKSADVAMPFSMRWRALAEGSVLDLTLGEALQLGWRDDEGAPQWTLGIGRPQPDWPGPDGVHVAAALGAWTPLEAWSGFGLVGAEVQWPSTLPETIQIDLDIAQLSLPGLQAGPMAVSGQRHGQDLTLSLDGEALRGQVQWPVGLSDGRALVADLAHLRLRPARSMETDWTPTPGPLGRFSGRQWPPMTLAIEELDWAGRSLGRLRWVSHPSSDGMELEGLDIQAPRQRLQARGRLRAEGDEVTTDVTGRLSGRDLVGLFAHAGYDFGIEAEQVALAFDLQWPGTAWNLHPATLAGTLELSASNGRIPEARPGAGRLIGLASFNALPRRLTLDFRDVFGTGLQFDDIAGQFSLANGQAHTEGVVIKSPAARITLSGDTDLINRQYQQSIQVQPGLGATLPVLGILASGPVGAAAGLLLQTIFDRPLRGVAEVRYAVTGPWSDPQVALVGARVSDEDGEVIVIDPEPEPEP